MCLAVPAKVVEIREDGTGLVDAGGAGLRINITLVDNVDIGDYVLVHAGFAIEVIDKEEAEKTRELFEEMARFDEIY